MKNYRRVGNAVMKSCTSNVEQWDKEGGYEGEGGFVLATNSGKLGMHCAFIQ